MPDLHPTLRLALLSLGATLTLSTPLHAEEEGDAIFEYREQVMEASAAHLKATSALLQGKVQQPERLATHTAALAGLMQGLPALFPPGSDFAADTAAKPEVWENPVEFAAAADKAEQIAKALHAAVEAGDMAAAGEQAGALGKACKACHTDFRQRK